ncbi:hypothetical protein LUCX_295 [Xanthomonas phage vB_XciM_LucasX]|nr:hypothetical protein LUCX_295 [Xanthomonas phage vB_XciM_LucasX]
MAGTKNLYNADPQEVLLEAIQQKTGVVLQMNYLTATVTPISGTQTRVRFEPKLVNGYCPYVDPIELVIDKLNLQSRLPKDMVYNGTWPATFETLALFMINSYGLLVLPDEWELVSNGTTVPMKGGQAVSPTLGGDRYVSLRTTTQHPLFVAGMTFQMFVTSPTAQ